LANERLEGGLVNFFSFVDVDRAAYVSVETRVEETGGILQRRAPERVPANGRFASVVDRASQSSPERLRGIAHAGRECEGVAPRIS